MFKQQTKCLSGMGLLRQFYLIVIIVIAFKGAIQDLLRTVSNMYAQVARAQSCANHVQHIERLSSAACRVTSHTVRRDSSAIKFDRV